MALDTNLGFHFQYRVGGGPVRYQDITVADTAFRQGDVLNLESGDVDLAVTTDTNIIGVANETKSGMTASTTSIEVLVIDGTDYVFSVYDANARSIGDTLDISGATGAMTVAASSNKELVVVADSTATEPTLVRFNSDVLWATVAQ